MRKVILSLLLGGFFVRAGYADTLSWIAPEFRENGEPITGDITFRVFLNGELAQEGPENTIDYDPAPGLIYTFEIYALEENGGTSLPLIRTIYINQSPPNRPR